jgi:hypothetical protein
MKANCSAAARSGDLPTMAAAFDKIAPMAPPGYATWKSIAIDGASAARAGDLQAARAACTGCHEQWRAKYKNELSLRPVPTP